MNRLNTTETQITFFKMVAFPQQNQYSILYEHYIVSALADSTAGCLWLFRSRLALRLHIYKALHMYNIQRGMFLQKKKDWGYSCTHHYYRKTNLSRLGNLCCPGFPTGNARPGQKGGGSFCPGSGNRDKRCCQCHVAGAPFCPGWCYPFFSCFPFLNSFSISIILLHFN